MAKNRRNQSAAVRFGPAVKAFLLCFFIGGSGVGYVWLKSQVHSLGRQIVEKENRLAELRRQNKVRSDQLAALCSPPALEARIRKLNLGLVQPPVDQIVRLVETPIPAPVERPREYAEQKVPHAFP
jgi:hypothetical protein